MQHEYPKIVNLAPPKQTEYIVKPRKHVTIYMPIVVCDSKGNAYYERDGRMLKWDYIELLQYLYRNWPRNRRGENRTTPIMLVCHNPHREFLRAREVFGDNKEWQVRLNIRDPKHRIRHGKRVLGQEDIHVRYFGFRLKDEHTRYFHPICPLSFIDDFDAYGDSNHPEYVRLYAWGGFVRKWIREHNLRFSPTRGGLAAQLLRDERFYPKARRKVPRLTNEKSRDALPGNFYALTKAMPTLKNNSVYLVDQENAHHYAARTVKLPDANTLFARGRYISRSDDVFARPNNPIYERVMSEHGLLRLRVNVPNYLLGTLPPWATTGGLQSIYIFTNELPLLKALNVEIRHISYSWTSPKVDAGLAKYAEWAEAEARRLPEQKAWLKPLLLSAYGILGARPNRLESAYHNSPKGEDHNYILRTDVLKMKRVRTKRIIQSPVANVIHRGMIEAETRLQSIVLARQLEAEGHSVLAIHADAVLVRDDKQLPLLVPPWRVKHHLNRFRIIDRVSFESEALTILPGRKSS